MLTNIFLICLAALALTASTAVSQQVEDSTKPGPETAPSRDASAEQERLKQRMREIDQAVKAKQSEGMVAMAELYEKSLRAACREFPASSEPFEELAKLAGFYPADKARSLALEVLSSKTGEKAKDMARDILKALDRINKPVDLKFQSLDGREIDVSTLRGHVVIIDFWATWCPICVQTLPHLKGIYEKLHPKGLEVIGVSFDDDKKAVKKFIEKEHIAWPQYCDGEGWDGKMRREWYLTGIPRLSLVDKKGILREVNVLPDQTAMIERLIDEE